MAGVKNLGAIMVGKEDLAQVKFWLRVFNLEEYVEVARADIAAKPGVRHASVPIISEHRAGALYFYYAIVLLIDTLGLSGGLGVITFASEENREKAETKRDEVADLIMKSIEERVAKGEMTGTMLTIEPTKES